MKLLIMALVLAVASPVLAVADALPAPTIALVKAGQAPRKPLRFAPAKGAKRTLVMTSQQATARGLQGKLPAPDASPAIKTTLDFEVLDVTADGDVRYQMTYRKAELVDPKQAKPELAKQLETALAAFAGLKGTGLVTSRGIAKEIQFDAPAGATPDLRVAIEMARSVATQLAQPLPDEAVGVGAKWQTSSTAVAGEVTAKASTTYELRKIDGGRIELAITTKVSGKGRGAGNLTTETSARGTCTLDLAAIVPAKAQLDLRTEVGLDNDGKRLAQLVTTKTTLVSN